MYLIKRTHDKFYAIEKNENVKQSFVKIADLIQSELIDENLKIADIGCAIGAFPGYLKNRFENIEVKGFEYSGELISAGKSIFPEVEFINGDITMEKDWVRYEKYFNVVTMLGVLQIFDEIDAPLKNIYKICKEGASVYIHGLFNPYPLDVFIKYQEANSKHLESGWNIISQDSMVKKMYKIGFKNIRFHEFKIDFDLKKKEDPVRSWTETLEGGERQIVNGLCIKQPQFILQATA